MMEFLEAAKNGFYAFTHIELWGYQIDTPLHLAVAFGLVLLFARFVSLRRSVNLTLGLIVLKEVVDFFATPQIYIHRPVHLDPLYDLISGGVGVIVAYLMVKWFERRGTQPAVGD